MSWNYRVMAQTQSLPGAEPYMYFTIHEVYYNDQDKPNGYSENAIAPSGESPEELGWTLRKMREAIEKPVLWYGDRFPEEYKPEQDG